MQVFTFLVLFLCLATAAGPADGMRRHDTTYYVIHTDLAPDGAAEAVVRMSRLANELRRRTRELGFTGRIDRRLPFYLYARHADYVAAGNPHETAGTFDGDRLVAAATDARGGSAWHIVQHEAFHQFAAATTGTELPAWLNEGFGEYFGEALFTGDGYVTGIVPGWRLERVKKAIKADAFAPLASFARISQESWNDEMSLTRYDQAWSMVQFLLHRDAGHLREQLVGYVKALAKVDGPQRAWEGAFGNGRKLETQWRDYWLNLPDAGTLDLEAQAVVATITSFVARATAQGQTFDSFASFRRAALDGKLRCARDDWLPQSLLLRALEAMPDDATVKLETDRVEARLSNGRALVATWALRDGRVVEVRVLNTGP